VEKAIIEKGFPIVSLSELAGTLASFAIQQSPYDCPDNLEHVVKQFCESARPLFQNVGGKCFFRTFPSEMALEEFISEILYKIHEFEAWNEPKSGHDRPFVFVSRVSEPRPDDDFIDLGALTRNVACAAFREARERHEQHLKEQGDGG
jgi:hypothetical protein